MRNFNLVLVDDMDIRLIDLEYQDQFTLYKNLDAPRPHVTQEFLDDVDWFLRASYDAGEAAALNAALREAAASTEEEMEF